ncbi:P-type conjugative transfer protein TrbJ [Brevundimonas diminuta]|uniref:P-type conjugative transfer protein TrbJ n=1 Tax=Brevundimonas TaxID=41275 RepID=UPI001997F274|nr:P-type conjugative transfer protein TrbJ [Brevundimonas diminuta]MBD3818142.1 P-type conjugative transfer protein TrbJ [Brevundimonas diminuta]
MIRLPSRSLAVAAAGLALASAQPASAQFGGIVYDPTNYAQNLLTATRTLQMINNQIQQLQNQATSLVNQARNLSSLPISELNALRGQVQRTQQLLSQAQRLAYDVQQIDQAFAQRYGEVDLSASDEALVADARERWRTSVGAFQDALKVQAGVVGNLEGTRQSMGTLVGASQSAQGALQAAQAGNQLLALQSQQLADLTALVAAQSRAQALEAARTTAEEAAARERFRRFTARSGRPD